MKNILLTMDEKLKPHRDTLLIISITLLGIFMTVISFFLVRTMNRIDNNFAKVDVKIEREETSRKQADEKLELMIDNNLSRREFNLYLDRTDRIEDRIETMQSDIKKLLAK